MEDSYGQRCHSTSKNCRITICTQFNSRLSECSLIGHIVYKQIMVAKSVLIIINTLSFRMTNRRILPCWIYFSLIFSQNELIFWSVGDVLEDFEPCTASSISFCLSCNVPLRIFLFRLWKSWITIAVRILNTMRNVGFAFTISHVKKLINYNLNAENNII